MQGFVSDHGRQEVMHVHVHVIGGPEQLGPMIMRKPNT